MKKFLGSLFLLAAFLTAGLAVSSCIINSEEESKLPQPTVGLSESGSTTYTISFPSDIGSKIMKYANIIRLSCDSADFSSTVTRTNIGQVFPKNEKDQPSTYQFWDPNTATGGTYYKYLVRYFNGSIYQYTNTTEDTFPGLISEAVLTGSPEIKITVDEQLNTWKLQLTTAVTFPTGFGTDSELAVVISNGTNSKSFTIASKADAESNNAESVDLQRILSEDFLDKKITIKGVVGIRKTVMNEDLSQEYTTWNWTNQKDITINWDWTADDGSPQSIDSAETSLTVPSVTSPDNQFDLNPNRISLNASVN